QPGVYTITYTYTNNAGCVNSSSVDIQVADCGCADPASADAGKDITICEGETVTLTGTITNAPGAVWSSNGTGLFSDANALSTTYEPSVTDIKKGSVKITLTTLDPDGNGPCHPYSDQLTITIIPLPKVSIITPPNEICQDGAILTLIATPQGGTWSGNGVSNDKFDPANAGIGDHKLTYTYINGTCKGEDSFTLTVKDCGCNTLVNVNAGPDINICDLQPVTLKGSVNGNFPVVWSTNGTGTFSDRYSAVTQYTPTEADREKQIISFTITSPDPDDDGPCEAKTDMMSLSITTLMDVNLKIDDTDCGHDRGSVTVLPPASNRFIFSVDNGNTFTDLPVFGDLAPGNYSLIYKDPISGCQSSKNFTINPPPLVAAQWRLITKACAPVESNFIDIVSTQNLTLPLDVYLDDKYTLTTATLPVKIDHLEIGKHTLKIKDANGCIVNDNFEITESSTIDVDILPVYVVDEGESAVLIPQINGPYTSIVWTPADYLSCTQCPTPTTTPDREITYLVTVTNQQGCEDSIDVRIIIRKKIDVFVPNIFTPNGDGLNDFVTIFTDSHIKIIDNLKIFSRWGELVFERSNFLPNIEAEGWDGNFRGQAMNPAVFAWVATINIPGEGIRIFKGDVTLIR
ncbi:MAG TPA: gliding motility-associated C-terminal domain-containing protein, partial [Saprospiraceae bacterium]|nr:gliding motility-associated C-terminal domain-containing protein [Saprospiraceae bacterium]